MTVIRRSRPSRPNAPAGTKKVRGRQIVTPSSGNYNRSIFPFAPNKGIWACQSPRHLCSRWIVTLHPDVSSCHAIDKLLFHHHRSAPRQTSRYEAARFTRAQSGTVRCTVRGSIPNTEHTLLRENGASEHRSNSHWRASWNSIRPRTLADPKLLW